MLNLSVMLANYLQQTFSDAFFSWPFKGYAGKFFMLLLLSSDFFQNYFFSKKSFRNTFRVSNGLDSDQDQHFVSPDMGPNCLQRLAADHKCHC